MAYRVELTHRAARDLTRLYRDIQAEDSDAAAAWFNGLEALVYSLDEHPNRSAVTPENKRLRHLVYGTKPQVYRIIYRVIDRTETVKVLHIRHGARDAFSPKGCRH